MFVLVLTLMLDGRVEAAHTIDNVQFKTLVACEAYKARMKYHNTENLRFTCTK
jgi:hypothetical protein